MKGENIRKSREIPAWFFLIASICVIVIAGIGAIALLAATKPAADNDSAAGNTSYQLTEKRFGSAPVTKSCVIVLAPPRNSGDQFNANGLMANDYLSNNKPGDGATLNLVQAGAFDCNEHDVDCYDSNYHYLGTVEAPCYGTGIFTCEPDPEKDIGRCLSKYPKTHAVSDATICEY